MNIKDILLIFQICKIAVDLFKEFRGTLKRRQLDKNEEECPKKEHPQAKE